MKGRRNSQLFAISLVSVLMSLVAVGNSLSGTKATTYRANPPVKGSAQVVSQQLVKQTPSYIAANAKGWYFCGQAAFATAFNFLREESPDNNKKITQLEYLHQRLLVRQKDYSNDKVNPNREASGDALNTIVNKDKSDEFVSTKYSSLNREDIKASLHKVLGLPRTHIVALARKWVENRYFDHFYIVYEITYDPTGKNGGSVKLADPHYGTLTSQGYTQFLDSMRDRGTEQRYSFWAISKKK